MKKKERTGILRLIWRRPGRRFQPSCSGSRVYADTHTHAVLKGGKKKGERALNLFFLS